MLSHIVPYNIICHYYKGRSENNLIFFNRGFAPSYVFLFFLKHVLTVLNVLNPEKVFKNKRITLLDTVLSDVLRVHLTVINCSNCLDQAINKNKKITFCSVRGCFPFIDKSKLIGVCS